MWYLISEKDPDTKYAILGGKIFIVGRRDCDILVTGDASVSRKHAELTVSHSEANLTNISHLPILRLNDLSKFGTWVNRQRVEGERILKDGDVVHFGSPSSSFMVVYEPMVVTTSCLEAAGKRSVRQTLCTLGGHVINEWKEDCSLLIMNKISVTIKVICAMVSLKPIVTPAYLEAYLKHLQGTVEKPNPDLYIPELAETQVDPNDVSFKSDNRRRTIFQGKTFVFMSEKQLKKMRLAIELAGGMPILMEGTVDRQQILDSETVVMNCPETDITKDNQALVAKATTLLQKNGKHLIGDAEIGYAVLYCSTEKHCNPNHVPDKDLSRLPSQSLSQVDPFAFNSESQMSGDTNIQKNRAPSQAVSNKTRMSPALSRKPASSLPAESETMNTAAQNTEQVQIKEEPLSGRASSQRKGQKRQRVEDEEEPPGTPVKITKIKDEPVSPAPKFENQSNEKVLCKNQSEKNKSNNQTGKSSNKKQVPEPVWDSDDDLDYSKIDDVDFTSSRKTRSSNQASSPVTRSGSVSPFRSKVKSSEKTHNEEQVSKSRSRSPAKSKISDEKSRSSSRSPVYSRISDKSRSRSPAQSKISDEKPRSRSPAYSRISDEKSRSRSPAKSKISDRVSESRSKSPVSPKSPDKKKKPPVTDRSSSRSPYRVKEEQEDESEIIPNRSRSSPVRNEKGRDVSDQRKQMKMKNDDSAEEEMDVKSELLNGAVPTGFLTTRKPIEKQVRQNKDYEEEADLPKACVQVEFTSLLVRRPKITSEKETSRCPTGYTRWKGKIVKNFKNFKKVQHSGSQGLPNIIGGSDLEVNQGQKSKEMDEWFREALQAESQHATEDRRAQDLFDYNPTAKRRGR